jgi:4-hydroxybutyryl-CoA dehydratase/vinylacetyl-CoA-Delta-isomerase
MYDAALEPEHGDVLGATSSLTGERVSRALHVPSGIEDLERSVDMSRLTAQLTGVCSYRCSGSDAIAAVFATSWEADNALGTSYHARFTEYLKRLQTEDLCVTGAMAGPAGEPNRRPNEQSDPDLTLRAVEKRADGIVLQGAKMHQSGPYAADEILVIPGLELESGEEAFAIACGIPPDSDGLSFITQYSPLSGEREGARSPSSLGNPLYGSRETCLVVFDHVFVPWDRVFLFGETDVSRRMVRRFSRIHRMNCGGACLIGYGDLVLGATRILAGMSGTADEPGTLERLADMVRYHRTTEACTIAAAMRGAEDPPGSGVFFPDPEYADVANLAGAEGFQEILKRAIAVGGALLVTLPSERDLADADTRAYLEKYLVGGRETRVADRMRMVRFLQSWVAGLRGAEVWHGAGSPDAQRASLRATADWDTMTALARRLAGLERT